MTDAGGSISLAAADAATGGVGANPFASLLSSSVAFGLGVDDLLAWLSIATFVAAIGLHWRDRIEVARYVAAAGSALFGLYWLAMVPYFWGEVNSPLETLLALAALPLCLYAAYLLLSGRDSMFVLVRAVAVMGIIYLPAETIPVAREWLIETTAYQTHVAMDLVAESPGLETGSNGYESRLAFDPEATATGRTTYIVLSCTGLGSMAIFTGLIASVTAPWRRKLAGIAAAVSIIWFLNLVRNVFIGLATPHGWFQQGPFVYMATEWMGSVPERASFLASHNVIAQPASVVALVGIAFVVIRFVPEVFDPLEEVLFVLTGDEYDLAEAFGTATESETGKPTAD
ncbi:archaeosortase A [Halovivax limisalsi]|uniref:archaeosortase A n=1 Tax=Halovivax limisalsi TaxID=1453760 RepID=UPI003CCE1F2D